MLDGSCNEERGCLLLIGLAWQYACGGHPSTWISFSCGCTGIQKLAKLYPRTAAAACSHLQHRPLTKMRGCLFLGSSGVYSASGYHGLIRLGSIYRQSAQLLAMKTPLYLPRQLGVLAGPASLPASRRYEGCCVVELPGIWMPCYVCRCQTDVPPGPSDITYAQINAVLCRRRLPSHSRTRLVNRTGLSYLGWRPCQGSSRTSESKPGGVFAFPLENVKHRVS